MLRINFRPSLDALESRDVPTATLFTVVACDGLYVTQSADIEVKNNDATPPSDFAGSTFAWDSVQTEVGEQPDGSDEGTSTEVPLLPTGVCPVFVRVTPDEANSPQLPDVCPVFFPVTTTDTESPLLPEVCPEFLPDSSTNEGVRIYPTLIEPVFVSYELEGDSQPLMPVVCPDFVGVSSNPESVELKAILDSQEPIGEPVYDSAPDQVDGPIVKHVDDMVAVEVVSFLQGKLSRDVMLQSIQPTPLEMTV